MAKKRKKKKPEQRRPTASAPATGPAPEADAEAPAPAKPTARASERSAVRRAHKEEARRARERALRQYRRRQLLRRVRTLLIVAAVIAAIFAFFSWRNREANEVINAGLTAARAAGCTEPEKQGEDPGGSHLEAGEQPPPYPPGQPQTLGRHGPPLDGRANHVFEEPIPQQQAIHNLEHGYVIAYYRPPADEPTPGPTPGPTPTAPADGIPQDVLARLQEIARAEDKVLLAPMPDLVGGVLAFTAWEHLQTCPAENAEGERLQPEEAETIARGFIRRFRESSNAPEPTIP